MADGVRLGSAVMFVQDLDRSVSFYTGVLGLEEADRSTTAALLVSAAGAQLILRAMGPGAGHPLGRPSGRPDACGPGRSAVRTDSGEPAPGRSSAGRPPAGARRRAIRTDSQ